MPRRALFVVTALLALVAACGDDDVRRDPSGDVLSGGDQSIFELQLGDCFDDFEAGVDVVTSVGVVPCSEPHDNEIFHEYSMTEAAFPGEDAALEAGYVQCLDAFEPFVGEPWATSDLDLFPITPTALSWDNGDRVVYCALYAVDLSPLTGSMRGSQR